MPAQNSAGSPNLIRPLRTAGLLLLAFLLAACVFTNFQVPPDIPGGETSSPPPPAETTPVPAISVYFSDPFGGDGTAETALVGAIDGAQKSVDMAIYNLSLESIADALIDAQERGVAVRMVMESDSMDKTQPRRLAGAGISIAGDWSKGSMHDKFTVIDGAEVWTGSMNYTWTSFYADFNNLVRLPSPEAARDYTVEFEEMYLDGLFGPDTRPDTPYPHFAIGGAEVEVAFSPDDGAASKIIAEIQTAESSIDFLAYSLTSDAIAAALLERAAAGVTVRGVFDAGQAESNTGGEFENLRQQGINVRLDGIDGLMHHKVILIDGKTVITGSYNFSNNAERTNDENLVILHDPAAAALYAGNFQTIYESGR